MSGQREGDVQATAWPIRDFKVATMALGNVTGYAETKPMPPPVFLAQTVVGLENSSKFGLRNTRPVIPDVDRQLLWRVLHTDGRRVPILDGVVHQVTQASFERQWFAAISRAVSFHDYPRALSSIRFRHSP